MDEMAMGGPSFTKELLLQSKKYEGYVDILEALLDDDKLYTSEEVDSLISTFMKRSVN
ncbi:hypothetical protein [Acidaminococcus provencensis]|uniref:hypothetical protein n=1 Tax=Acidaminococcus provencensis TaxID=2058289 RepID=UPI00190E9668|nr:hypothetical protein [Acidaminococcus provencensis]